MFKGGMGSLNLEPGTLNRAGGATLNLEPRPGYAACFSTRGSFDLSMS
jgi:hypothetical protein